VYAVQERRGGGQHRCYDVELLGARGME
jgi:hypothetical protein